MLRHVIYYASRVSHTVRHPKTCLERSPGKRKPGEWTKGTKFGMLYATLYIIRFIYLICCGIRRLASNVSQGNTNPDIGPTGRNSICLTPNDAFYASWFPHMIRHPVACLERCSRKWEPGRWAKRTHFDISYVNICIMYLVFSHMMLHPKVYLERFAGKRTPGCFTKGRVWFTPTYIVYASFVPHGAASEGLHRRSFPFEIAMCNMVCVGVTPCPVRSAVQSHVTCATSRTTTHVLHDRPYKVTWPNAVGRATTHDLHDRPYKVMWLCTIGRATTHVLTVDRTKSRDPVRLVV